MNDPLEEFMKLHKFYAGGVDYRTKEIAEYVGVSTRTIQNWMKQKTIPSEKQQNIIQDYLNMKASEKKPQ